MTATAYIKINGRQIDAPPPVAWLAVLLVFATTVGVWLFGWVALGYLLMEWVR